MGGLKVRMRCMENSGENTMRAHVGILLESGSRAIKAGAFWDDWWANGQLLPFRPRSPSFASSCRFLQTSTITNRQPLRIKKENRYRCTWARSVRFATLIRSRH